MQCFTTIGTKSSLSIYTKELKKHRIHPAPTKVYTVVTLIQPRKPMISTTSVVKAICTS